jgi:dihydrofolate reductase
MRPLVCFIATSLDGYIAGPAGEIDWLFTDQDYGYTSFYANVDTVVMGRKTYDLCLTFPEYPYPKIPNYVWSRTLHGTAEHVAFVAGDIAELLKGLKNKEGKTIWLVGGSALVGEAIKHDLLDELIVSVHPIVLGDGVPLYPRGLPKTQFQFIKAEAFNTSLVQLTYQKIRRSGT